MYQTKITSQGTISIPAALRKKYDLKAGQIVTITDNGQITIVKNSDFEALRQRNAKYITGKPFIHKGGDGFTMYVMEKYGK
jgi:AbrB family looped-hinge helix DNA binding protein